MVVFGCCMSFMVFGRGGWRLLDLVFLLVIRFGWVWCWCGLCMLLEMSVILMVCFVLVGGFRIILLIWFVCFMDILVVSLRMVFF